MLATRVAGRKWPRLPQGLIKSTRSSSTYTPGGRIPKRPFEKCKLKIVGVVLIHWVEG